MTLLTLLMLLIKAPSSPTCKSLGSVAGLSDTSLRAKVPDATQSSVTGLQWFKIQEDGYDPSTGKWAVDTLIANKGKVSVKIPSCIAAGQYLMRHEIIGASSFAFVYSSSLTL